MKTKKDIDYPLPYWVTKCGGIAIIPKGTRVIPADNLPEDSEIKYWARPWAGMYPHEESHMRNYGFGLRADEVERA